MRDISFDTFTVLKMKRTMQYTFTKVRPRRARGAARVACFAESGYEVASVGRDADVSQQYAGGQVREWQRRTFLNM